MYNPEEEIARATSLENLLKVLEILFDRGYAVDREGRLYLTFVEVARVNGLKIFIRHREHPPPHFHVKSGDVNASFDISTGELLEGKIGNREKGLVQWWHGRARQQLIQVWNQTRPSDCPVGPIADDA